MVQNQISDIVEFKKHHYLIKFFTEKRVLYKKKREFCTKKDSSV